MTRCRTVFPLKFLTETRFEFTPEWTRLAYFWCHFTVFKTTSYQVSQSWGKQIDRFINASLGLRRFFLNTWHKFFRIFMENFPSLKMSVLIPCELPGHFNFTKGKTSSCVSEISWLKTDVVGRMIIKHVEIRNNESVNQLKIKVIYETHAPLSNKCKIFLHTKAMVPIQNS